MMDNIRQIIDQDDFDDELKDEILNPRPVLQIFVSSSMPKSLLKQYAREAKQYNGVLTFRGLTDGSFRKFTNLVYEISEEDSAAIQIDDVSFTEYGILQVPTIILSKPNSIFSKDVSKYDKITGAITIKAALEIFANSGDCFKGSKRSAQMIRILLTLIINMMILSSYAHRTNINEVSDLFDENIDNKDMLFEEMRGKNTSNIDVIKSQTSLHMIEGAKNSEGKSQELNSIGSTDLGSAGKDKRLSEEFKFYDQNAFEPNYSKPGNIAHREDAEAIVKASNIVGSLMDKLNEFGFDCKTVKGAAEKEPIYHIDIKREEQKNTEYNQFLCEELRNRYNCTDTLHLKCIEKEFRTYTDSEDFYERNILHWITKDRSNEWLIKPFYINAKNEPEIRRSIAATKGISERYISNLKVCPRGNGRLVSMPFSGGMRYTYRVYYDYKDSNSVSCLKWREEWHKRCILQ